MRVILCVLLSSVCITAAGQPKIPVSVFDFVRVNKGLWNEALFYYENNWKVYRDVAMQRGYVTSYQLVKARPDSLNKFDILLITEYADSLEYTLSEKRFESIIRELSPDGPKLLNNTKPGDFRTNLFNQSTETVYRAGKKTSKNSRKKK